jgi:predicted ATP-grasp superfamily ATP-dependent carboligase
MGVVGVLACSHLAEKLGAEQIGELPAREHFDLQEVTVQHGMMQPPRYPRTRLYRWRNPAGADLVLLLAEAQPQTRGYALCEEIVTRALELGVGQVVTFAAMATPSEPTAPSRVHGMATDPALLERAKDLGVELLEEGAVSGMNGVLLAAARARELPGLCLLGEFPYYASGVPQPKAAAAVLRCFARLAGVDLDLSELDRQAEEIEARLVALLERLQREAAERGGELEGEEEVAEDRGEEPATPMSRLDAATLAEIEALFSEAERDRQRALELKALLDRHGVFREFEDRFLDLFKHGE